MRYVFALSAVALLSTLGQALVQMTLTRQRSDARVVNFAGRQRMLSQKLSKAALAARNSSDVDEQTRRLSELKTALELWERSHEGLKHGDPQAQLPGENSADVTRLFEAIEPNYRAILSNAHSVIEGFAQSGRESTAPYINSILINEGVFLEGMDRIVSQYELEAREKVELLKRIEITLLCITLSVLVVEGLLVFRPAVKLISKSIEELELANEQLTEEIAARRQAEKEMTRHAEELSRSNSDLEAFAHAASHDLKEPLRSIVGCTELFGARYRGKLDADADQLIKYTEDECKRLKQVIDDVLRYSSMRTRDMSRAATDANIALDLAIKSLRFACEESECEIVRAPLPTIMADPLQLSQIFLNLISNAIKYRSLAAPRVEISAEKKENDWVFVVRDNGMGIDANHFEKLFVPFKRLHGRSTSGTGIGLALCKRIIERHGGKIWVESKVGAGSSFYFSLPDSVEPPGAST
jgi:signal transduction histidine kinase